MIMSNGTNTLIILASYPRRFARLIGYVIAIVSGSFYLLVPPVTTTAYLNSSVPAMMWGALLVIGGGICIWAWFTKVLIIDRIGLSIIITALVGSSINQLALLIDSGSWTRGGNLGLTLFVMTFLVSRWQDVKHDEWANGEATKTIPE